MNWQDANHYRESRWADFSCESQGFQDSLAGAGDCSMMMHTGAGDCSMMMMMPTSTMPVAKPAGPVAMPSGDEEHEAQQDRRELNAQCTQPVIGLTTLMIRGIPCSFSQETLMSLIDSAGLQGKYDFFYLPRAGNNGSNLGYAFINFTHSKYAEICAATFNGVPLDPQRSVKVCKICPADIQGYASLRKQFRRSAVSRGSRRPVFLKVDPEL
jgi:hypothetical protein